MNKSAKKKVGNKSRPNDLPETRRTKKKEVGTLLARPKVKKRNIVIKKKVGILSAVTKKKSNTSKAIASLCFPLLENRIFRLSA